MRLWRSACILIVSTVFIISSISIINKEGKSIGTSRITDKELRKKVAHEYPYMTRETAILSIFVSVPILGIWFLQTGLISLLFANKKMKIDFPPRFKARRAEGGCWREFRPGWFR